MTLQSDYNRDQQLYIHVFHSLIFELVFSVVNIQGWMDFI